MPEVAYAAVLSHDLQCQHCHHPMHTYLPCSDSCDCASVALPGVA